ncbi:MAG: thioesterase family protein [Chloracidobacterium sp.]|uniref:Acyl-CoA thioesterase n=1 Tax=Chloracidobacterium validum TaxID=2821543 RepID=A0ABX8BAC0_9BACT|nr:thioesterase family protein [Chloracidobacterium validum]QUW03878.1 acyl-CoA thioesterase [Chloracidobacterium validum]
MLDAAFSFTYSLRVRWAEVDAQGVVFNGHYLTYFDVGVTEYWRAAGLTYPADFTTEGTDLFLVKATVEYHAPAGFDDLITIGVRCARLGRSSMTYALGIYRQTTCLTSGELVYVNANPQTRTALPIPAALRERLSRFEAHRLAPPPGVTDR